MIKKKENCKYCGEKMESRTAKKSFCSAKCRVYFYRTNSIVSSNPKTLLENPASLIINNSTSTAKTNIEPPLGLKGIDLIIWKIENQK